MAEEAGLIQKYDTSILSMLEYSFKSQEYADLFSIGERSGVLMAVKALDRDTLCANKVTCQFDLDIKVLPGEYFQIIKVRVILMDMNDNVPTFPEQQTTLYLSEAANLGTVLKLPTATDPDSPAFSIKNYTISPVIPSFISQLSSNLLPELKLTHELDREYAPSYSFILTAYDGESQTGTVAIDLQIRDINDNNPTFDNQTYETSMIENMPKYTTILKVHAQDLDDGPNGKITYYFSDDTAADFGALFGLDSNTGEIFVKEIIDYEEQSVYRLQVGAKDQGVGSIPAAAQIIIHIVDINDHAPQITINDATPEGVVQVREAGNFGDFVAHISVEDLDGGDNGKFNCSLEGGASFRMEKLYETEFKIVATTVFDREQKADYDLVIVCQDQGDMAQSEMEVIKVHILDVNDHKPVFSQEYYEKTITENNKPDTYIVQVNATDTDVGENAEIHYFIEPPMQDFFRVDELSGVVTAKIGLDHEMASTRVVTITARDAGTPSLSASTTVVVHVKDVDDNAPQFDQFTYVLKVLENMPSMTYINQINATDPDDNSNSAFIYGFDDRYNPEGAFTIDPDTGRIYTTKKLDREHQAMYHLVVTATSLVKQLVNKTNVFISILDENDNRPDVDFPSEFNNTVYLTVSLPVGFVACRILAHDNDTNENAHLSYNITSGNEGKYFTIDQATGAVLLSRKLKDKAEFTFNLLVIVYDGGIPVRLTEVALNIVVNKSTELPAHDLISNQNLAIVISIATVSGLVMVVLAIAIVFIIRKQRKSEQKKYNYMPRIVDQKLSVDSQKKLNGSVQQGKVPPGGVIRIEGRSSVKHPKRQTSIGNDSIQKDGNLNESFDKSMEKLDIQIEYAPSEVSQNTNQIFRILFFINKVKMV